MKTASEPMKDPSVSLSIDTIGGARAVAESEVRSARNELQRIGLIRGFSHWGGE